MQDSIICHCFNKPQVSFYGAEDGGLRLKRAGGLEDVEEADWC